MRLSENNDWNFETPLIIAGPCSAESEEQTMATARALKEIGVGIFRAGVWKARTRPNSYEGAGSKALEWLKRVKNEIGLKIATEVANPKHIEECLKAGVDILWIGARTSVNPFAMAEIATELKGLDLPILVKNPINPDINLWTGAIERIQKAGIVKIGAIHRGFSSYQKSEYRYPPFWDLPIELKRRFPEMPILCDPSHICGNRKNLFNISQTAMNLMFDGLIIESHISPETALSDKNQQITPAELSELINNITVRKAKNDDLSAGAILDESRIRIDELDAELIRILGERMTISEKIGRYKKENNISIFQSNRWQKLLQNRIEQAENINLGSEMITKIFNEIHKASIEAQNQILNG